jgi:hypothetical protein
MTKFTKCLLALGFVGALGQTAHADGILFEPAVTYEMGDTSVNYPSPISSSSGTARGLGFGARVGMHIANVFLLGIDGRYSIPQFKDSSVSYDAPSVSTNWGPTLGFQMPIVGLRVWGTYIAAAELNPDKSGSLDVKFTKGTGYRVGTGFHFILVSVNLEYQQVKYDNTDLENAGPFTGSFSDVKLENKTWIVSASFPLEF